MKRRPHLLRVIVLSSMVSAWIGAFGTVRGANTPSGACFECLAWVDHFDFAGCKDEEGRLLFDTETPAGWDRILDHVQETGATVILWRNCAGATMRYQSAVESHHQEAPLDKRVLPDNRPVYGWVRYGEARPDILRYVFQACRRRGVVPGVHWPFEENHWQAWTLGSWNLDHPQYWCRTESGRVWPGRCSIGWPEVRRHKAALLGELVDRGMEVLFIDTWRSGGWSPSDAYAAPIVAEWRRRHPGQPLPAARAPEWTRHVAGYTTKLFREMRQRMQAAVRPIRFYLGLFGMDGTGATPLRERGVDWQQLVREGTIDGIVVNSVPWNPKAPFESTRRLYERILAAVNGRCQVFFPVRAYDYGGYGMPSYTRVTGLSQHEVAERLLRMAWESGADGVSLECVDYGNYTARTRRVLHDLLAGPCRYRRILSGPREQKKTGD